MKLGENLKNKAAALKHKAGTVALGLTLALAPACQPEAQETTKLTCDGIKAKITEVTNSGHPYAPNIYALAGAQKLKAKKLAALKQAAKDQGCKE